MTSKAIRVWYAMTVTFLVTIVFAAASVLYSNQIARDSQRKWCGIIVTMDESYRRTPPQTPAGREIAADVRQLRKDFDCD